jgi:oligopeptide/dipeptide ABC transporter ATP-binding protein
MAMPLLSVRDISVEYRRGRATTKALDGVSFDVFPGETVGLVGESGSGKSTAARAILGLTLLKSGSIHYDGRDVTKLVFKAQRDLYRHIQIVFQDPYSSLNPSRTVGGTLAEPLRAYGHRDRESVTREVLAMLERVQLPADAFNRYPAEFSGGQRQRVAIARALMLAPRLVVCDEATSALDLSVQAQILNLLRDLQADTGLSYLFISHDLDLVRYFCDRVIVLYQGQSMESGAAARVARAPAHPYTYELQSASPRPDPREQRSRREANAEEERLATTRSGPLVTVGCPFAPRCGHAEARCWTERPEPRSLPDHGLVACHRYPEWQAEVGTPETASADAGSAPSDDVRVGADRGAPTSSSNA